MDDISTAKALMADKKYDAALKHWRSILETDNDNITALVGSGDCLMVLKDFSQAVEVYERARTLQPGVLPLLYASGTAEAAAGRLEQAREHLTQYLAKDDTNHHAHNNLATVLTKLGDLEGAERHNRRARQLNPERQTKNGVIKEVRNSFGDHRALFDAGVDCIHRGDFAVARDKFQSVIIAQPDNHRAWECLGVSELGLGQATEALKALDEALKISPEAIGALHHRAIALRALGRFDESFAACTDLLAIDPGNAYAHSIRGAILLESGRIPAAVPDLEAAIAGDIGENRPALQAALAYAYRALCRWDADYDNVRQAVIDNLSGPVGKTALMVISPFQVLPLGLDGNAQAEVGRRASHKATTSISVLPKIKKPLRSDMRIRLGYLSPDFCSHSLATALHEVIVRHDRSRFSVEGFSLGRTHDDMTRKFNEDFDALHDISSLSYGQAAAFIAHRDIDILIELAGHTRGARSEILAYKPAPVQVSAIGYGAPVCADFIDWHLVDKHLVPEPARRFYDESLVDMPDCSLPAPPPLSVDRHPGKAEAGLPESGILLANFGGSYKIDPFTFDVWMKILAGAPEASLVLLDNTEPVNDRLRAEAKTRGVSPDRLVFAPFLDRARHLGRYAHVDLCLDTLTHNGGVTTTDALWLGVPVLTMRRDELPDRMGPSLLFAAGLPELVTENIDDFVATACALANDQSGLVALRQKVAGQQGIAPLFDTALYTKNLEKVLLDLWAKAVDNPFTSKG